MKIGRKLIKTHAVLLPWLAGTFLALSMFMKGQKKSKYLSIVVCALLSTVAVAQNKPDLAPPAVISAADKTTVETFEKQVKDYVELRSKLREKAPKLSKDSTPEQIHAYRETLEQSLRSARANAKRGDLFRPETADYIRRTLKIEFQGKERQALRETIFETETQGVVLRVNYPYAQTAEFSEMPATLLAKLPQVPKEVRYRFVGRSMLLVDRESNVIIDFMTEALP